MDTPNRRSSRKSFHVESLECRQLLSGYTLSALASLTSASGNEAFGGAIMDSAGNLYGTAESDGANGDGAVFEVAKGSGVAKALASFNDTNGSLPAGNLILDSAGNLYGTTQSGGADEDGAIFELAKGSSAITVLASFNGTNGASPTGGLLVDSAGNFYGTAFEGGVNNDGTVYKLAKGSHTITALASGAAAAGPVSNLIMDSAGNLYGTSQRGGAMARGSVFELPKGSSSFVTLASFNITYPTNLASGLTFDAAGNLYGTTFAGGDATDDGTVFEVVKGSGVATTLAQFNVTDGSNPTSALLIDSAGDLFGVAQSGGNSNQDGTVFEVVKGSSAITTLAVFNGTDGRGPTGMLSMDAAGNIYGATQVGGANDDGAVFVLSPPPRTYSLSILANFAGTFEGQPQSGLVMDSAGNLFGTANVDANDDNGAVFEVAKGSTSVTTLAKFNVADGMEPSGSLLMDSAGNLYGTTQSGGANSDGAVFELKKGSSTITLLASFNGTNGRFPLAGLIADSAGNFYGTTAGGGVNNDDGVVFEVVKGSGKITTLASADALTIEPEGELVMDSAGNLYGTSTNGGPNGQGEIFELAKGSSALTLFYSFNHPSGGRNPSDGLILDAAGNFYGTTQGGTGAGDFGRVFKLTHAGVITYLATFNGTNGQSGFNTLFMDAAGDLFGTAEAGGNQGNYGTAFEVVHGSGAVTQLATFNFTNGSPTGPLVMDSAGDIFGTASAASENDGLVWELSPIAITKAPSVIHASDRGGVYTGKPFPATGFVYDTRGGAPIATPVFTYYLASDKTFSHPLPGAPTDAGSYMFLATFAGDASYLPTKTSAAFTISKAPSVIHASDLGGAFNGKPYPATGFVAGVGGAHIATPVFTYYLASDTTFSNPLAGAPSAPGNYIFRAIFAGNNDCLPTATTAPFSIKM